MIDPSAIRSRYEAVTAHLDERGLRLFAAGEARAAGRGGITAVAYATGMSRNTIRKGLNELEDQESAAPQGRVRRTGGGRKQATVKYPGLVQALKDLIESAIRGDPETDLLWVSLSQRHLVTALMNPLIFVSNDVHFIPRHKPE